MTPIFARSSTEPSPIYSDLRTPGVRVSEIIQRLVSYEVAVNHALIVTVIVIIIQSESSSVRLNPRIEVVWSLHAFGVHISPFWIFKIRYMVAGDHPAVISEESEYAAHDHATVRSVVNRPQ